MQNLPLTLIFALLISRLYANEDHLVLIPIPIIHVGDGMEHTVIKVPCVSRYGLDFISYCGHITFPYMADIHSPSSKDEQTDIHVLSKAGFDTQAKERPNSNVPSVTLDFSAVKKRDQTRRILHIATDCVYRFGDDLQLRFATDFVLKGLAKDSPLHKELKSIQTKRRANQAKKK